MTKTSLPSHAARDKQFPRQFGPIVPEAVRSPACEPMRRRTIMTTRGAEFPSSQAASVKASRCVGGRVSPVWMCAECGLTFSSPDALGGHRRFAHRTKRASESVDLGCPHCYYEAHDAADLQKHLREEHGYARAVPPCPICGAAGKVDGTGVLPFTCTLCGWHYRDRIKVRGGATEAALDRASRSVSNVAQRHGGSGSRGRAPCPASHRGSSRGGGVEPFGRNSAARARVDRAWARARGRAARSHADRVAQAAVQRGLPPLWLVSPSHQTRLLSAVRTIAGGAR